MKKSTEPVANPNPPPAILEKPVEPTTTTQQDLTYAGQRRVNLIWEITQAILSLSVAAAFIYCSVAKIDSPNLTWAFLTVVTSYLVRTNHEKTGGVGRKPEQPYEGR